MVAKNCNPNIWKTEAGDWHEIETNLAEANLVSYSKEKLITKLMNKIKSTIKI